MLRNEKILCLVLFAAMIGLSIWGHFTLPDAPMAVHFGLDGEPNGYQPRDMALFVLPLLTLVILVLCLWALPALLQKHRSIERSQLAYGAVMLSVTSMLTIVHAVIILRAAGADMDVTKITTVATGLIFVIMGNYLPKTRINGLLGVRTVWTLADERVWDRTHRFAGPVFMLAGGLVVLAALALPVRMAMIVLLSAIAVAALLSYGYSYLVARRLR
ncbi:MAG: SdpI family protein [Asticcacaulis sp.]